jgi:hypothetical protein
MPSLGYFGLNVSFLPLFIGRHRRARANRAWAPVLSCFDHSIFSPILAQSRSQSMPVRGLYNPRTGILWERELYLASLLRRHRGIEIKYGSGITDAGFSIKADCSDFHCCVFRTHVYARKTLNPSSIF